LWRYRDFLVFQDGGGRHVGFWKIDEMWHGDTNSALTATADRPLKFRSFFSKIQYGSGRHVENHKNRDISATV